MENAQAKNNINTEIVATSMRSSSLLFIAIVLEGAPGGNGTGFGVRVGNMRDSPPTAIVGPARMIEISSVRPGM